MPFECLCASIIARITSPKLQYAFETGKPEPVCCNFSLPPSDAAPIIDVTRRVRRTPSQPDCDAEAAFD